ncbi:MAG: NUDIX hydrolase [Thaumarchaeota archaeon]|nr:NUDIX hydrolase [Nitrososphaerota archaeon]
MANPKYAVLQRMKKHDFNAPDQLHVSSFVFIRNKKGEILLEKIAKDFEGPAAGKWVIPGLVLKFGEHPDEGAKRVFVEELEIKARPFRFYQNQSHLETNGHWDILYIYESDAIPESQLRKPAKGIDKFQYYNPAKLPKPLGYGIKDILMAEKKPGKTFK